jgi:hypothetical protein
MKFYFTIDSIAMPKGRYSKGLPFALIELLHSIRLEAMPNETNPLKENAFKLFGWLLGRSFPRCWH